MINFYMIIEEIPEELVMKLNEADIPLHTKPEIKNIKVFDFLPEYAYNSCINQVEYQIYYKVKKNIKFNLFTSLKGTFIKNTYVENIVTNPHNFLNYCKSYHNQLSNENINDYRIKIQKLYFHVDSK
ncbi:hypothetical protein PIROE2DRAFT_1931 [Piromyces sp. E2]|nr:hypothetical protein PIROE2DRAFT_1931 [Piromyces sp. E2]|eukprot:OUM69990.1 hypothetical protein PIROE2DRAFT_1931 [Piromyces sp. E2]